MEKDTGKEEVLDYSSKIKRRKAADEPVQEPEAEDDGMCIKCGRHRRIAGDYYCSSCLDAMRRKKPPVLAWIFAVLTLAATVVAAFLLLVNFSATKRVLEARKAFSENRIEDAYNAYEDAFDVVDEVNSYYTHSFAAISTRLRIEEAEVVSKMYMPVYGYSFLKQYYSDDEMKADPDMKGIYQTYEDYTEAYSAVSEYVTAADDGTMTADEAIAKIKAKEADFKDNKDQLFWILYVESYVDATENELSDEEQLAYVERMEKECPGYDWYYLGVYRDLYYSLGRYDECLEMCKKENEFDHNDADPYITKLKIAFINSDEDSANLIMEEYLAYNDKDDSYNIMNIMTLRRFGSVEEATSACEDAITNGEGDPELYRQKALNCLINGDYDGAYDSSYNAFTTAYNLAQNGDTSVLSSELLETTYVCAMLYKEKGDGLSDYHSDLQTLLDALGDYSDIISDNAQQVLAGTKTVLQVLTEGTGDLA